MILRYYRYISLQFKHKYIIVPINFNKTNKQFILIYDASNFKGSL